jgi:hypothetical protein
MNRAKGHFGLLRCGQKYFPRRFWYGHRFELDERRIVSRNGRSHVRFRIPRLILCCRVDGRLRSSADPYGRPDQKVRKIHCAPDFIGDRYYSQGLRVATACVTILISLAYCVGQFGGIGLMFKWVMGLDFFWSTVIGSVVVLAYTMISGMLGVTKNMMIQYVIIIVSFLIPLFMLTFKFDYFWLLPQIGYGAAVTDIVNGIPAPAAVTDMINSLGHDFAILPSPEYAMPWDASTGQTFFQWMAIVFLADARNCRTASCYTEVLYCAESQRRKMVCGLGSVFHFIIILEFAHIFRIRKDTFFKSRSRFSRS